MSILGIDVGYKNTKITGELGTDIFASTVKKGTNDFNKSITLSYLGQDYTIGEPTGSVSVGLDKVDDEVFNVCLLTAIARNIRGTVDPNVKLVTGLPIDYYQHRKTN